MCCSGYLVAGSLQKAPICTSPQRYSGQGRAMRGPVAYISPCEDSSHAASKLYPNTVGVSTLTIATTEGRTP